MRYNEEISPHTNMTPTTPRENGERTKEAAAAKLNELQGAAKQRQELMKQLPQTPETKQIAQKLATIEALQNKLKANGEDPKKIEEIFKEIDKLEGQDADAIQEVINSLGEKNPQLGKAAQGIYEVFRKVMEFLGTLGSEMIENLSGSIDKNGIFGKILSNAAVSDSALAKDLPKLITDLKITPEQLKKLDPGFWSQVLNHVRSARKTMNYGLKDHLTVLLTEIKKESSSPITSEKGLELSQKIISDTKTEIAKKAAAEQAAKTPATSSVVAPAQPSALATQPATTTSAPPPAAK